MSSSIQRVEGVECKAHHGDTSITTARLRVERVRDIDGQPLVGVFFLLDGKPVFWVDDPEWDAIVRVMGPLAKTPSVG